MPACVHQVVRLLLYFGAFGVACTSTTQAAVNFEKEIEPIIESACLHCHNEAKSEGELRLDSLAAATADDDHEASIVPGDAAKSPFYTLTLLPAGDDKIMPPDGPPLDETQTSRLRAWIQEGALWPKTAKLEVRPRIDFVKNVQPILETHCVSCHSGEEPQGDFNLATRKGAFASGSNPPAIKPFYPEESPLYALTNVPKDDSTLMPPTKEGGPLAKKDIETLRLWIAQGAIWPKDVVLKTRPKKYVGPYNPDDLALVQKIRDRIITRAKAEGESKFVDYTAKVPQTGAPYSMVAIKGGEFLMGSPETEAGRNRTKDRKRKFRFHRSGSANMK